MTESKLRFWEIALLFALAAALMWGSWSLQQQDRLERKMIRLHVIANSDSEADQALKLQVRDRVLTLATDILRRADSREQAERDIEAALPDLQAAAADEIADIVSAQCPPVVPENCDAFSCRECWLAWLTTGEPPKEKGPSDKQTAPDEEGMHPNLKELYEQHFRKEKRVQREAEVMFHRLHARPSREH